MYYRSFFFCLREETRSLIVSATRLIKRNVSELAIGCNKLTPLLPCWHCFLIRSEERENMCSCLVIYSVWKYHSFDTVKCIFVLRRRSDSNERDVLMHTWRRIDETITIRRGTIARIDVRVNVSTRSYVDRDTGNFFDIYSLEEISPCTWLDWPVN